jgi:hypothetical protein
MNKAYALLSAAIFAGGLATAALAHDEGRAGGEPTMRGLGEDLTARPLRSADRRHAL